MRVTKKNSYIIQSDKIKKTNLKEDRKITIR